MAENNKELSLTLKLNQEQIQQALKQLGNKMEEVPEAGGKHFEELGKKIQEVGEGFKEVGEKMTTHLTLPIAAIGGIATKTAMDMEKAQGKIQAQLGLTGEEAEKMGGMIEDIWGNAFGESVEEVGDAIATVKQNMQELNDTDLQDITEKSFILRDVFGAEISESTRTASVMMKNFGISAEESMDLLTVGFQKGGNFSDELLDTMREYAPQFSQMGMSAEEMMNSLISGSKAGAFNVDKVGDAVKEFNIRAKDGSDLTAESFELLNLNAAEMGEKFASGGEEAQKAFQATLLSISKIEDPMKRNQIGVGLFGTMWEDVGEKAVLALNSTENHLGKVEGATDRAGKAAYDNFGTRMTEMWRNLLNSLQPLGEELIGIMERFIPKVQGAVEWFTNLSDETKDMIVKIGLFIAAAGPLLMVFGTFTSSLGGMIGLLPRLGTAFTLLTGPVGLVTLGVGGLILGLKKLFEEGEKGPENLKIHDPFKEELDKVYEETENTRVEVGKKWAEMKSDGILTSEEATEIVNSYSDLGDQLIAALDKKRQGQTEAIKDLALEYGLDDETADQIINTVTGDDKESQERLKKIDDEMRRIEERIKKTGTATEAEMNRLDELSRAQARESASAVGRVYETQNQVFKEKLKEMKTLNGDFLEEEIKGREEQLKHDLSILKKTYDERISIMEEWHATATGEEKKKAKKMLKMTQSQYSDEVEEAVNHYKEIYDLTADHQDELEGTVENGNIRTNLLRKKGLDEAERIVLEATGNQLDTFKRYGREMNLEEYKQIENRKKNLNGVKQFIIDHVKDPEVKNSGVRLVDYFISGVEESTILNSPVVSKSMNTFKGIFKDNSGIYSAGKSLLSVFTNGIQGEEANGKNKTEKTADEVKKPFSLTGNVRQWGSNFVSGWVSGAESGSKNPSLKSRIINAFKNLIPSWMFFSPAKEGPGRYVDVWGSNFVSGWLDGVEGAIPKAKKVLANSMGALEPSMSSSFSIDTNSINSAINSANQKSNSMFSSAISKTSQISVSVNGDLRDLIKEVKVEMSEDLSRQTGGRIR